MAEAPKLDVLVISHNHPELILTCLPVLYKHTRTPFHLIIVDDSTDLTPLHLNQFCKEHDNVTYIHSSTPYKTGNQIFLKAFEHCKTPYMATVMNSLKVEPDWELGALQVMESDPKIGVVGLKCLLPNGIIESASITMAKWLPCDVGRGQPSHRFSLTHPADAVQWAFALVRVEAGKQLEPFVFNGFRGWDDIDNCLSLKKNGWKIFFCGQGVGYHEPRATRGDNSEKAMIENRENGITFFKRHGFYDEWVKQHPDGNVHAPPADLITA